MDLDIVIKQGKTFSYVFRWGVEPVVYKQITAIPNTAPATLTVPSHGLPPSWAAAIESVEGMTDLNAQDSPPRARDYYRTETVDPNTVQLPDVNPAQFDEYESGGYIRYYTPVDLAGYSARMKIKMMPGGEEYLSIESPTDIVLDNVEKTITVTIAADVTAALDFVHARYDLEMVINDNVYEIAAGDVELIKEITA